MTAFFAVDALAKAFAGVPAVDGLSFAIERGAIVGLVGPNGSGKSTTIDCLTGFQSADAGRWTLDGRDLAPLNRYRIAHAGVTRTFQAVQAYERLSVIDNLRAACQEYDAVGWLDSVFRTGRLRAADAEIEARARQLLEIVGLTHLIDAPVQVLSYGQRKLLAIAGAMMSSPKLVFLDEPVAGVNPTMINRIAALLRTFNERGVTLVVVDHNMEFIMRLCHRVIVLDLGRAIADGPPAIVQSDARVLDAYMGAAGAAAAPA
ncbi:MAG: ABC transporter ATP-binding protein [Alphaproteobacteria bacterium]|nr:ABC transporter ATP-binding protein [Alphaproteobacteria bacterium]